MFGVITHNSVKTRILYVNKWLSYSQLLCFAPAILSAILDFVFGFVSNFCNWCALSLRTIQWKNEVSILINDRLCKAIRCFGNGSGRAIGIFLIIRHPTLHRTSSIEDVYCSWHPTVHPLLKSTHRSHHFASTQLKSEDRREDGAAFWTDWMNFRQQTDWKVSVYRIWNIFTIHPILKLIIICAHIMVNLFGRRFIWRPSLTGIYSGVTPSTSRWRKMVCYQKCSPHIDATTQRKRQFWKSYRTYYAPLTVETRHSFASSTCPPHSIRWTMTS